MNETQNPKYFYRYTSLAAAIHLLTTKQITLLDPVNWDDKNDTFFIRKYKECEKAKTVLVLCFTESAETYQHWKTFSGGTEGVSINFEKHKLLSAFSEDDRIEHGYVKYSSIREIEKLPLDASDLPFFKRRLYKAEKEYRVIYTDPRSRISLKNCDIELSWIKRIRLNPWMPKPLVKSVREILKSIPGCQ